MNKNQIIQSIVYELKKVRDREILITIYLFIKKLNSEDDN